MDCMDPQPSQDKQVFPPALDHSWGALARTEAIRGFWFLFNPLAAADASQACSKRSLQTALNLKQGTWRDQASLLRLRGSHGNKRGTVPIL